MLAFPLSVFCFITDEYMKQVLTLSSMTFKGGIRDKTLSGIGILSLFFMLSTPLFASFSPRQVGAAAVDCSLSVLSLTGLLLTLFVGVTMMAGDIDKKSIYTVISQPISRDQYLIAKYLGFVLLIFISTIIIVLFSIPGIFISKNMYHLNNTIFWGSYFICVFFVFLKLCIMASAIFLFSTIATSTFLPFGVGIAFYFVSESIENVKRYIEGYGMDLTAPAVKFMTKLIYYIFPNFSAFDLKKEAIYGLTINSADLIYLFFYGVFYITILLVISVTIFNRREFM